MKRLMWFVMAVTVVACGSKNESKDESKADKAAPGSASSDPAAKAAKPPKGQATVAITVTGEVEKTFSGPIGHCEIPVVDGKPTGATYTVEEGDLKLTVLATNEAELSSPKIILNRPRVRWELDKTPATGTLQPGKSAEFEAELLRVGAIVGPVHVKGTFTCNPD